MLIDLKLIRVTVELNLPSVSRLKRRLKHLVPSLAMTCDYCGQPVRCIPDHEDEHAPWWWCGCKDCHTVSTGATEQQAQAEFARTGGRRLTGKFVSCARSE